MTHVSNFCLLFYFKSSHTKRNQHKNWMKTRINNFDIIDNFRVIKTLANGGFGTVYFVREVGSNHPLAMKIERDRAHRNSIDIEYSVLKQIQNSLYFPRLYGYGSLNDSKFIVMEMLGPSLNKVRSVLPASKFSISTSLRLGIEMICMLREFHARGFVHRDVKPANFLVRPGSPSPICLIDFGLAKRFIDPVTGKPHQQAEVSCFIGTVKYASINAHKHIDLGPRDDIVCWFNTMTEMITGRLPWDELKDKAEVLKMKENLSPEERCRNLPHQFINIFNEIQMIKYHEFPDYDVIIVFLSDALRELTTKDDPYDWEKLSEHEKQELFPPSVTRRISFGDALDVLTPKTYSSSNDSPNNKVEQFQLLGDSQELNTKKKKRCNCCLIS